MAFIDLDTCHRMAPLWRYYSITLNTLSMSNILNVNISKKVRNSLKMWNRTVRFLYLPPNGTIAKVVLCDLDTELPNADFKVKIGNNHYAVPADLPSLYGTCLRVALFITILWSNSGAILLFSTSPIPIIPCDLTRSSLKVYIVYYGKCLFTFIKWYFQ